MKKNFTILILLIILILIAIFFYLNMKNFDNNLFNKTASEKNIETNSKNGNTETQNNPQTSGSNEESSDSQPPSQNSDSSNSCYNKQITYSIENINEYYFCNLEDAGSCIDKTAKCSIKVKNLDKTIGGNFEIRFSFFEKENRSNIVETSLSNSFIAPNEEKILKSELVIQGGGADKNISCYYSTTEVPKEKICS